MFAWKCDCYISLCMCAPSASIAHFVPIISKGMGPNTAIHISIRATEAATSENGGLGEQEGMRGGRV